MIRPPALRLDSLMLVMALGVAASACHATAPRAAPEPTDVEWRTNGGSYASAR